MSPEVFTQLEARIEGFGVDFRVDDGGVSRVLLLRPGRATCKRRCDQQDQRRPSQAFRHLEQPHSVELVGAFPHVIAYEGAKRIHRKKRGNPQAVPSVAARGVAHESGSAHRPLVQRKVWFIFGGTGRPRTGGCRQARSVHAGGTRARRRGSGPVLHLHYMERLGVHRGPDGLRTGHDAPHRRRIGHRGGRSCARRPLAGGLCDAAGRRRGRHRDLRARIARRSLCLQAARARVRRWRFRLPRLSRRP